MEPSTSVVTKVGFREDTNQVREAKSGENLTALETYWNKIRGVFWARFGHNFAWINNLLLPGLQLLSRFG
jgi:hypothetical protein